MRVQSRVLLVGLWVIGALTSGRSQPAVVAGLSSVPVSSNREDVKAIGMGKAQIADGRFFNAMMYNPALLAQERFSLEIPGVQASLPTQSFNAISFLANNVDQFRTGQFVTDIKGGLNAFRNAGSPDAQLVALRRMQRGLRFLSELQDNVGGTLGDPKVHGISVIPSVQVQVGSFGFALYGVAQTAFTVVSGAALTALSQFKIPDNPQDVTLALLEQLDVIARALVVNPNDANPTLQDNVIPVAAALSYIDIVAAGGYANQVTKELSVGGTLKVLNRRFSSRSVAGNNYDNILVEVQKDFNNSATGVTFDLGALYLFPTLGTRVGLALQNIIPVSKVRSDMNFVSYGPDQNNQIVPIKYTIPFELTLPFLFNVGAMHPLTENWDVALDWVDIASQDDKHETYIERFRLGSEYRLDAVKDKFGVAFRAGLADKRVTAGVGLNIFRVLQLDGAYAYDNYVGENSWFAQLKLGW